MVPTQDFTISFIFVENKAVVTWGTGEEFTSSCLLLNHSSLDVIALFILFK